MRARRRIIVAVGLAAVVAAAGYRLLRDRYRPGLEAALRGELRRVNFRPHSDADVVSVTEPADLNAIRAAVLRAEGLPAVSKLGPASCELQFVLADGRVVDMRMSEARTVMPVVLLEWGGYKRQTDATPFKDADSHQRPAGA